MQAEALRRAQEMHRTRESQQKNRPLTNFRESAQKSESTAPKADPAEEPHSSVSVQSEALPVLFEDKEKLLILVLIMILCTEESCDPTLILALLYLII